MKGSKYARRVWGKHPFIKRSGFPAESALSAETPVQTLWPCLVYIGPGYLNARGGEAMRRGLPLVVQVTGQQERCVIRD